MAVTADPMTAFSETNQKHPFLDLKSPTKLSRFLLRVCSYSIVLGATGPESMRCQVVNTKAALKYSHLQGTTSGDTQSPKYQSCGLQQS